MDGRDRDRAKEVNQLLEQVQDFKMTSIESDAYNYLIDYCELGFFHSHEASRLLGLCIDIIKSIIVDLPNREHQS